MNQRNQNWMGRLLKKNEEIQKNNLEIANQNLELESIQKNTDRKKKN